MLPLFIYFVTIDWLKYEWVKLLFHAVSSMPYLHGSDSTPIILSFLSTQFTISEASDSALGWLCIPIWLPASLMTVHQSVSQSLCQPHSQLISQSVTQSICQLVSGQSMSVSSQSVTESPTQSINQADSQSVALLASYWPHSQLISQSVTQSIYQLVSQQSMWVSSQSVSTLFNQPTSQWVFSQWVDKSYG